MRHTVRHLLLTPVLLLLTLCLAVSCSAKKPEVFYSADEIVHSVLDKVSFFETLEPMDDAMIPVLLGDTIRGGSEDTIVRFYAGSRACADTLIVLEFTADANTSTIRSALRAYADKQTASFKDYKPEEVTKLENPVLLVGERTAVLCLTDDYQNASQLLKSMIR